MNDTNDIDDTNDSTKDRDSAMGDRTDDGTDRTQLVPEVGATQHLPVQDEAAPAREPVETVVFGPPPAAPSETTTAATPSATTSSAATPSAASGTTTAGQWPPPVPPRPTGPHAPAIILGLVVLAVAGIVLAQELGNLTVDWGDVGPLGFVAVGAVLVVLGAVGLISSNRRSTRS